MQLELVLPLTTELAKGAGERFLVRMLRPLVTGQLGFLDEPFLQS